MARSKDSCSITAMLNVCLET